MDGEIILNPMTILFQLMIFGYAMGVLGALLFGHGIPARGFPAVGAVIGAGSGFILGVTSLTSGHLPPLSNSFFLPLTGFSLCLDGLSSIFLIVIGLVGVAAAIYGFGYSKAYEGRYSLRMMGAMLNILLLSLALQVMANNALTFLIMWEIMSLSAYWLVLTERDQPDTVRAANWYIAMTHAGFAAIMAMFFLLSNGELSASFANMRSNSIFLSPLTRDAIFLLALFGFGTKAGIVPLHIWLPMAHPVAPSHISAVMSGVVIKMGIYGILRIMLDLLGGGPAWWGGIVLGVGATSALLGVLYALMEHDLKRLLAYHSVENIGIILIGIGAGLILKSFGLMTLAALGFIGGLYHTINHTSFKGLLFLSAGSVLHATHTRNMEEMGGLIKKMPWTALFFLIGSVAISALPPLNGFTSEWLVFQALLGGFNIPTPEVAIIMPIAVGMLALTSGLAAACFVKAFGITFLALPRSQEAEQAHESPLSMKIGMGILALACIGLGLGPFVVVPMIGGVLNGLGGLPDTRTTFTFNLSLQTPSAFGQISPPLVMVGLLILFALILIVMKFLNVNQKLRVSDTWGCGRIGQTSRMEYTATSFAEPLRRVFAELYQPTKELNVDFHPESKYFIQSIEYKSGITPLFERWLYDPFLRLIHFTARQVRKLQSGSLHLYLTFVTIILIILLLIARWL
jgi:hydrogenase-4 component B